MHVFQYGVRAAGAAGKRRLAEFQCSRVNKLWNISRVSTGAERSPDWLRNGGCWRWAVLRVLGGAVHGSAGDVGSEEAPFADG